MKAQDKAAEDSVVRMEKTGSTLVTDGEQRTSSYDDVPSYCLWPLAEVLQLCDLSHYRVRDNRERTASEAFC